MTAGTLEARLRGALADPVGTDALRNTLEGLVSQDAIARFTRDPRTKRTTLVEVAPPGEAPVMRLHPTYDAEGLLAQVFIEDTNE